MRDLLDDIATVLGVDRWNTEKVPAADIPARLRTLAPDWAPYRTINGLDIRRYLETAHGVKVPTTGHKYPVAPAAIREAIARRDTARVDSAEHPGRDMHGPRDRHDPAGAPAVADGSE